MRRALLYRMFALAAGLSLALCVATSLLWIWSAYDPSSDICPTDDGRFWFIEHDDARVAAGLTVTGERDHDSPPLHRTYSRLYLPDPVLGFFAGAGYANITWNPAGELHA